MKPRYEVEVSALILGGMFILGLVLVAFFVVWTTGDALLAGIVVLVVALNLAVWIGWVELA